MTIFSWGRGGRAKGPERTNRFNLGTVVKEVSIEKVVVGCACGHGTLSHMSCVITFGKDVTSAPYVSFTLMTRVPALHAGSLAVGVAC